MMNVKNAQSTICLVIFFLFANQAWAEEWIYYSTSATRDAYYDKSSIKTVNNNISLNTKLILYEDGKTKYFSFLKNADKAPNNPELISYVLGLSEIDCVKGKMKELSLVIYDEKNNVLYSSPKAEIDKWYDIIPNSAGEKLKNIVCEKPVAPQEAVVAVPKETVRSLVTKWLNSWKSGDMETYRSCYASDFKSKRMKLDAWVTHKTKINQKSKNINISIDKLQISEEDNNATAVFTQSYSSSIFKHSGKKKLELRKINREWKIYREIM